jgi:hypothetical protein
VFWLIGPALSRQKCNRSIDFAQFRASFDANIAECQRWRIEMGREPSRIGSDSMAASEASMDQDLFLTVERLYVEPMSRLVLERNQLQLRADARHQPAVAGPGSVIHHRRLGGPKPCSFEEVVGALK